MRSVTYLQHEQNRDKQRQPLVIMDNLGHRIRVWPPAIDEDRLPGWYLKLILGFVKGGAA